MRIIAECSSLKSVWALVENGQIIEKVTTEGINPFFQTRREISHIIRLGLPETFFKRRWEHVFIYCAGCTTDEKKKIVEASAVAQFKTPVTVESNLLGAARGLLHDESGIACILDVGSNSCQYDGLDIVKQVRSLGFILGDEGSGSAMGKLFVSDCLKGLAPKKISEEFYERFNVSPDEIMDDIYSSHSPSRWLSEYAVFLSEHIDDDYVSVLVKNELKRFFERNILQYDYDKHPVSFVGKIACLYSDMLRELAINMGIKVAKIEESTLEGLIAYHENVRMEFI
jgi:N-acetylglucosamine kinase-like BadF-type ATPase